MTRRLIVRRGYYNFPIVILDGLVQYYSVLNIKMMVKATICLL